MSELAPGQARIEGLVWHLTARGGDSPIEPCTGEPPAGAEPIEVNAW